jgi:predicted CoA-binding protein
MTSLASIKEFLEPKKLAIAGVSRNSKKFGRMVYEHLRTAGYEVYPVNPHAEDFDGHPSYRSISELPDRLDRVLILTPAEETARSVQESLDKGIRYIWIQQQSDTPEALELARNQEVNLIYKKCIFMYAEPVKGVHAFHRFLARLFGSYPK